MQRKREGRRAAGEWFWLQAMFDEISISSSHQVDGDLCSEGEDVGARDEAGADVLDGGFDVVDHVVTPHRQIRERGLLALHAPAAVQQDGCVASLQERENKEDEHVTRTYISMTEACVNATQHIVRASN